MPNYIILFTSATSSKLYNYIHVHHLCLITLQAIHKNHTVLEDRFTAMFREWLQSSPNPTWDNLVEALRSPDINRPDIAAEIEDKLIKRDDSSLQENKDTSGE